MRSVPRKGGGTVTALRRPDRHPWRGHPRYSYPDQVGPVGCERARREVTGVPDRDRVTQTSAYLRMLLLRPGEYRTRWERLAAHVEPGKIDTMAVAEVLAGSQTDGVDLADTARRALDGTVLTTDTLGR